MSQQGSLHFGTNSFELESASFYGIFEPDGYTTWWIELYPAGEDNYIMFNALIFEDLFSPQQLSGKTYNATAATADLYEHTVVADKQDRFLGSVSIGFGEWDTETQSIQINGEGTIDKDGDLKELTYKFTATLKFKELNIFETTKEAAQQFIDTYLSQNKDGLAIKFEDAPSGLHAAITGQF